jgi:hypothetical protein
MALNYFMFTLHQCHFHFNVIPIITFLQVPFRKLSSPFICVISERADDRAGIFVPQSFPHVFSVSS